MSMRQPMPKNRQNPSKYFFQVSVVLSLICMFLIVSSPVAFAKTGSEGTFKSALVKKDHKKQSSRFLRVFVKGGGKILSSPKGLRCRERTCWGKFPKGTKVVLEAMPVSGKVFSGWRGVCGGSKKCTVRLNRHKNIQAVFSRPGLIRLAVKIKGDGKVRSYPRGLSCEKGFCKGRFPQRTKVVLKAIPASGKVFSGWRGVCGGKGKCVVRLNRA